MSDIVDANEENTCSPAFPDSWPGSRVLSPEGIDEAVILDD